MAFSREGLGSIVLGAKVAAGVGAASAVLALIISPATPPAPTATIPPELGGGIGNPASGPERADGGPQPVSIDMVALADTIEQLVPARPEPTPPKTEQTSTTSRPTTAEKPEATRMSPAEDETLGWRYLGQISVFGASRAILASGERQFAAAVGELINHPLRGDVEVIDVSFEHVDLRVGGEDLTIERAEPSASAVSVVKLNGGAPARPATPNTSTARVLDRTSTRPIPISSPEQVRELQTAIDSDDPLEVRRARLAQLREQRRLQRERAIEQRVAPTDGRVPD